MSSTLIVLAACVALVSAVAPNFNQNDYTRRYREGRPSPNNNRGGYQLRQFAKQDPNRVAYHDDSSSSSSEHEHEHFKEGRWARPKANFRFSSDAPAESVESASSSSEAVKQDADRPEPLKVIQARVHEKYVKAHAHDFEDKNEKEAGESEFAQRVVDALEELNQSRAHGASVAHRSGRVSVVGIGLDDVDRVSEVLRERLVMRRETLLSGALLPNDASAVGVLAHIKVRKGEAIDASQLRLVSNFLLEELFDALDLLLGGLLEDVPFASRKNLVVQRLGDANRFMHIALPTLIPVELDDGSFKGDAHYLEYEPLVHELTYHLERKSAHKPLSTKPNAALDSAAMWLALLRGIVTVGVDTLEHDKQNHFVTAELVARLRKLLANARLGATITAAGNWVNAQHLMGEWRARLLVGTAVLDADLMSSDKPITFLVPYFLAATVRTLVDQHAADPRLALDANWTEDTIVTGIQAGEINDDDDNNNNDDGEDDDDGAPPRPAAAPKDEL